MLEAINSVLSALASNDDSYSAVPCQLSAIMQSNEFEGYARQAQERLRLLMFNSEEFPRVLRNTLALMISAGYQAAKQEQATDRCDRE